MLDDWLYSIGYLQLVGGVLTERGCRTGLPSEPSNPEPRAPNDSGLDGWGCEYGGLGPQLLTPQPNPKLRQVLRMAGQEVSYGVPM